MKNYLVSIFFLIGVFNVYAQEKVITAPGSYSFSTSFSFGQPSAELKKYYNKDFLSLSSLVKYRTDGKMDYRKDRLFSTDSSVTTYSYNDNGQLAKIEQKLLLSGTIIYLKEYFYNANNQLVKSTLNADTDAYIEEEILFEYDASGNVIKEVTFYPKYTGRKKIVLKEYNENKNVISESVDENSDGIFEKTLIVKFDTYNRQVYFNESNKNGQRMLITNKYIGPTIVITTSNYQNKDTFPYSIFRKTIDAKGITVLEESINSFIDNKKVVTSKSVRKWIYDTAGIIPKDFSYCDYPSDNFTCYYDKKGRKIKEVYGSDAVQNGKTFENTYIEGGRKHIISEFDNSPRKLVSKYINIFDSSQNMISSQLFYGKDSKAANLVIFDYDSHSNLIRRRVFINDTILRNTDSFIYDNAGHKLRHFFIGKNMNVLTAYDENGNTTIADNRFYEFENFRRCPPLGKGLAHVLKVEIPYSGNWEFNVTTTNFNNVIAISDANNEHNYKKMMDSNPVIFENKLVIELNQGIYYFVIAGKEINDAGVYKLVIKRVN